MPYTLARKVAGEKATVRHRGSRQDVARRLEAIGEVSDWTRHAGYAVAMYPAELWLRLEGRRERGK